MYIGLYDKNLPKMMAMVVNRGLNDRINMRIPHFGSKAQ